MDKKVELLAPAGDIYKGKFALNYGADAIYLGAKAYSLRARSSNFDFNDLKQIIDYAHIINKKIYLVTNILCHNAHIKGFDEFIKKLIELKPDAFICADPFVVNKIRELNKDIQIHISTQQSVCNSKAALFFKQNDCQRIILAREVSYNQIVEMIKNLNGAIDIEYFIHGALCIAYSGRCMISNNFSLRDSNVGGCAQSCRWVYKIYDDNKVYSNKFSMSAKDMNQIKNIPDLIKSGISSFKIEGRMKSEYYIATVVNTYRKIIDEFYQNHSIANMDSYMKEILHAENRKTSYGWFNGSPTKEQMLYYDVVNKVNQIFAFIVLRQNLDGSTEVISKNNFNKDQEFEIIGPNHETYLLKIKSIKDGMNNSIHTVSTPMSHVTIYFDKNVKLDQNDIGRIHVPNNI